MHLDDRMHWVAIPACARENISSPTYLCRDQRSITKTSPKLKYQETRASKSVTTDTDSVQLLFDGRVDVITTIWEDGDYKRWWGL